MMIILVKSSFLGSNYAVKQKMTMKTIGMVIIIMFPTLQCLDPWEFAVRLSQQRCARSYPAVLSTAVSCALPVPYCVAQCLSVQCNALLNSVKLYQLNSAMCCADSPHCCAVARHKAAGHKDL